MSDKDKSPDPLATIQQANPKPVSSTTAAGSADADPAAFFAQTIGNQQIKSEDDNAQWHMATQQTAMNPAEPSVVNVARSASQPAGTPALEKHGSRIWATTSGNGLDGVVAIRSRPVFARRSFACC